MSNKLFELFQNIYNQLPDDFEQEEEFVFGTGNLPNLVDTVFETEMICIKKVGKSYGDYYKVETLEFLTNKKFYRILGLLLIETVINNKSVVLNLINEESYIKQIKFGYNYLDTYKISGLIEKPIEYRYWAEEVIQKNPYSFGKVEERFFPHFHILPDEDNLCITDEQWNCRNVLEIGGDSKTLIRLAEMFLDIGNPKSKLDEFVLESFVGFRGVAPGSAEITFWLPNSLLWTAELNIPNEV